MHQSTRNRKHSKSGSSRGQRCTLDHVHDASCDYGRKASPKSRRESIVERESVSDPYSVGKANKLPDTSKESDSEGWHRTTDRT